MPPPPALLSLALGFAALACTTSHSAEPDPGDPRSPGAAASARTSTPAAADAEPPTRESEAAQLASLPPAPAREAGGAHGDALAEADDEPAHDGAWLYARNCAGCHGETGHGDGETARQLGVQARDFAAGGFSFGNTHEDLLRTIRSGIPGRSVMPAFGGILQPEEIELVALHVATLMPPAPAEDREASVMRVGARAELARGKLPPVEEGAPQTVRGLLVGLPSGLTFEYDLDPVRLLAVRLGPFADREDWRNRGGGYLRPLGVVVHVLGARASAPAFERTPASEPRSLVGRLESTWTRGEQAGLDYVLVREPAVGGEPAVRVHESLRAVPLSAGGAYARALELRALDAPVTCQLVLAGDRRTRFDAELVPPAFRGRWSVGAHASEEEGGAPLFECVRLELPPEATCAPRGDANLLELALRPGEPARIEAIVALLPDAKAERLAGLEAEIEALRAKELQR